MNDDVFTLLNIYYFQSDRINFLGGFSNIADLTIQSLHHLCHLSKDVCHSSSCTFNTEIVFISFCWNSMLFCIIFVFYLFFVCFFTFVDGVYLCSSVYLRQGFNKVQNAENRQCVFFRIQTQKKVAE